MLTENIMGFKVTEDHDWWTCTFDFPDKDGLYSRIKKFEALGDYELFIGKNQENIEIEICVHLKYGNIAPKDPYIALANKCCKIRENILRKDFSDLVLLKAYVEDKNEFGRLDSSSGIKDIIEKNI